MVGVGGRHPALGWACLGLEWAMACTSAFYSAVPVKMAPFLSSDLLPGDTDGQFPGLLRGTRMVIT